MVLIRQMRQGFSTAFDGGEVVSPLLTFCSTAATDRTDNLAL